MIFDRNTSVRFQFVCFYKCHIASNQKYTIIVFINNTDDKDWKKANPDKLRNGVQDFEGENKKELLYMFLVKYVRKMHSDSEIKQELTNNKGM